MWSTNLRALLTTFITCLASFSGLFMGKAAEHGENSNMETKRWY